MDPRELLINDFTYELPEERIAFHPPAQRDASRLLIYQNKSITEDYYNQIADHIPAHALLVFNQTKVISARLLFQKTSGGVIEIFCLEPGDDNQDITSAMLQHEKIIWQCMVGGASKWKPGQVLEKKITIENTTTTLFAECVGKKNSNFLIQLSWSPSQLSFAEVLNSSGVIPLPPYIKRAAEAADTERYQTVYAAIEGSVAAPTAGLHFTPAIFAALEKKNIHHSFITLHVGAGTFKPVKSETMHDHDMHAEFIDLDKGEIENISLHTDLIIAVGTTSLRTLESLYWLGIKTIINPSIKPSELKLSQWEAYDLAAHDHSIENALKALLGWMNDNKLERLITSTQILIAPGYSFKMIKALITNFHQPQSTLLLLVAALIGDDWRKVYDYALQNDFRFLSYGDGSLLWKKED